MFFVCFFFLFSLFYRYSLKEDATFRATVFAYYCFSFSFSQKFDYCGLRNSRLFCPSFFFLVKKTQTNINSYPAAINVQLKRLLPQNEAARNIPSNPRAIACLYYFKYGKRRLVVKNYQGRVVQSWVKITQG